MKLTESDIEQANLDWLSGLGWGVAHGPDMAPEGKAPERASYGDVLLLERLKDALARINPQLPPDTIDDIVRKIVAAEMPSLIEENRRLHKLMVDGVAVQYMQADGTIKNDIAWIIDWANQKNDWLAVNQFTIIEERNNRRPDILLFVNGLPLGIIELKNAGDENATVDGAFRQTQAYKQLIPSLFRTNAIILISDGLKARIGSLTSDFERFMPWRTVDGTNIAPKGTPELHTIIHGVCDQRFFLEILRRFTVFQSNGKDVFKIIAGYHQFHAVRHAVDCTLQATASGGDRKVGVIWHTQGSGKSLLMAFYAGAVIASAEMHNPTLVVLTDRNDLDDQLFGTFSLCRDLIRQTPAQADNRDELRKLLSVASGGVIFTTIQKFLPADGEETFPLLTDRKNVIVIADEAHRSQYGFKAKIDKKTGDMAYGFAKHLRDALPNASFIGFTGTPIENTDVNTPAVFGDYIDVYDIQRAVEDGATVPIYYESRLAKLQLDDEEVKALDAEVDDLTEDEEANDRERKKSKWSRVEAIVGAETRLKQVAADIIQHFENRLSALDGKGMIVCMSRRICVALYDEIIKLRPEWHSEDDTLGALKIVMTGNIANDPPEWLKHTGSKARRDLLAKRARNAKDPLKLVIVRDMWLTGFDAPCMHTMYVDKPMHGHGLMQAIARVNRVFRDKPGGLIVDYIGIAHNLKQALSIYSPGDREEVGIDERQAVSEMMRRYEIVRDMFHGFDYLRGLHGTPAERLGIMAEALEWVLDQQQRDAAREQSEEAKKQVRRKFPDAVVGLSKAYALAATSPEAGRIRDEVGFFQAIRAALMKGEPGKGKTQAEVDVAVQQMVSRAVVSTEIVDILSAAGIKSPDISILSEEFLAEIQGMKKKNLALEALQKLINGEIKSRTKSNVVQSRKFSERLEAAVRRYHNNAITAAQLLEELIAIAKDIKADRERGEEQGLSEEEIAFYDALAENESAIELLGDAKLRVIATELVISVRNNVSVDWMHRDSARAKLRIEVKKILKKYGYPPDLQDAAVQLVLQQAEVLAPLWA
ncbi:MAG: type I restriction endonuclease subunit R [Alphaproteobacteria bacterium]|nr:type I restriction endonuclease subunit R [Alphaproteobacteria bacterium]